jgi:hypothetical protein
MIMGTTFAKVASTGAPICGWAKPNGCLNNVPTIGSQVVPLGFSPSQVLARVPHDQDGVGQNGTRLDMAGFQRPNS